ncbi:MAG TPA: RNA polymerase sigma factor region1.1 domain-containing protein, partial [Allosphingosinicella sp.]|nr:RNA polymerase sigma factor region1.1 domain-containing protein [Allosphingosinicella sp.]
MAKTNTAEPEEKGENGDAPLIDLNEASLKKLISRAKKRGYITYDELNDALPQDQMSSEQIEDVMSALSEMGVNIVENEEADEDEQPEPDNGGLDEPDGGGGETFILEKKKETVDRTDDPVRMYLREMGAVELLSREGEIAIAKRIEAGRDTMIWGLCESPITFNAIIEWSNALNNGMMQLREILDLEAMLSKGPTPEQVEGAESQDDTISETTAGPSFKEEEEVEEVVEEEDEEDSLVERRTPRPVEEEDEDNTLSLAQMEEALKPAALDKFATITGLYKKFAKLQNIRM